MKMYETVVFEFDSNDVTSGDLPKSIWLNPMRFVWDFARTQGLLQRGNKFTVTFERHDGAEHNMNGATVTLTKVPPTIKTDGFIRRLKARP